ncbi:MAG: TIGR02147 family protein [Bdellovibrionales bacterium]
MQLDTTLFNFEDYRDFIISDLKSRPKGGHGQLSLIARSIGTSPTIVTLVLQKERHFTLEQANSYCEAFALNELEVDYFLASVHFMRAGTPSLRNRMKKKLLALREKGQNLKDRIPPSQVMNENVKAKFYSQWYYSGIRLSTSIEKYQTIEAIAERHQLPLSTVKKTVNFLLEHGFCTFENGKLNTTMKSTHLEASSELVSRHHTNWRLKAFDRIDRVSDAELFFTSPVSISVKDVHVIRELLVENIENVFKIVDPSPSEELACLNIDWFLVK